jgi:hypothetical protein
MNEMEIGMVELLLFGMMGAGTHDGIDGMQRALKTCSHS